MRELKWIYGSGIGWNNSVVLIFKYNSNINICVANKIYYVEINSNQWNFFQALVRTQVILIGLDISS